jgi:hypothetical protein
VCVCHGQGPSNNCIWLGVLRGVMQAHRNGSSRCCQLPVRLAGAAQQQAQKQAQQRQQQQRQRASGKEGEDAEGEGKQAPPVVDDRTWLQKNWLIVMAGATMVSLQVQHRSEWP